MTLLGATAVLIAIHQSIGEARFLAVILPLTIIDVGTVATFHASPMQLVQADTVCAGIIAAALTLLYMVGERSTTSDVNVTAGSAVKYIGQLEGNQ